MNAPPFEIRVGDCRALLREMPAESVQCVVTSPPYFGLRDYGAPGQIGLEETPEAYVDELVRVFREVRRVLRSDGTLWLNLGDSYAASRPGNAAGDIASSGLTNPLRQDRLHSGRINKARIPGLKPKDLIGIPWRVALALQADGWWLRSDVIWNKPNPMPESVTDRPTKSHEYVFLLTKSETYYYDAVAVKETDAGKASGNRERLYATAGERSRMDTHLGSSVPWTPDGTGRNLRSVWTITTKPFEGAHFATFPVEIPERCIRAGTSAHGACPACGAPWERVVERTEPVRMAGRPSQTARKIVSQRARVGETSAFRTGLVTGRSTVGWQPTCDHETGGGLDACVVLDPFSGAGTTGLAALLLGRRYIGLELNAEYAAMSVERIRAGAPAATSRRLDSFGAFAPELKEAVPSE